MSDPAYEVGFLEEITKINFGSGDWFRAECFMGAGSDIDPSSCFLFKPQAKGGFGAFDHSPTILLADGNAPGPGITSVTKSQLPIRITAGDLKHQITCSDGSKVTAFGCFFSKGEAVDQSGAETFLYIRMPDLPVFFVSFFYGSFAGETGEVSILTYPKATALSGKGMAFELEPKPIHGASVSNDLPNGQQGVNFMVDSKTKVVTPLTGPNQTINFHF